LNNLNQIPLVKQAEKALKVTYLEARLFKTTLIGTEHLLLAILKDEDNLVTKTLEKFNVDYTVVRDELKNLLTEEPRAQAPNNPLDDDNDDDGGTFGASGGGTKKVSDSKSKTPVLDNFGRDLTR
jgi:ATP-dependent Clp protease ATP-binding subunit ClpC